MKPSECGFASPPADGTREREIIDRFAEFLAAAGPAVPRRRSPARRYRLRYMAWRTSPEALDLAEQLEQLG